MDLVTVGFVGAHVLCLGLLVWASGRVGLSERFLLFFALFYSIAPLVPFERFRFFRYYVDYAYDPMVLLVYSTVALFIVVVAFVVWTFPPASIDASDPGVDGALRILWWLALGAWVVDVTFNWRFFLLPKNEYILSIPQQTKNLFLFTIPAKELLAAALVFPPFRASRMRQVALIIGALAVLHSLILGARHVALLVLLLLLLPRMRSAGVLVLSVALTFFGEISNAIKVLLSPASEARPAITDLSWWGQYAAANIGVSGEQKAILSNLLIKLTHSELLDPGRGLQDIALGLFGSVAVRIGVDLRSSSAALSSFVGVLPGEGTGYSLHVGILESIGVIVPFVFVAAYLAHATCGTLLFILAAEIFYSMMRNGPDYWLAQTIKLAFLIGLVWFVARGLDLVRSRGNIGGPSTAGRRAPVADVLGEDARSTG